MSPESRVNIGASALPALRIWLLRIFVAIFILVLVCFAAVYVFLQRDPDALVEEYLRPLERKYGLEINIGSVDVTLLPLPALSLGKLSVTGSNLSLKVDRVAGRPGLLRMFRGDFAPAVLDIVRPRLEIKLGAPLDKPGEWLETQSGENASKVSFSGFDCELTVSRLGLRLTDPAGNALTFRDLDADLDLARNGAISGKIGIAQANLRQASGKEFKLQDFTLAGQADPWHLLESQASLKMSADLAYDNVLRKSHLNAEFENSSQGWSAPFDLNARLDLDGIAMPLILAGRATGLADSTEILARELAWELGHDSGTLALALNLPENAADFRLTGSLTANRLSLTQWMGWARNLTPGLQLALDNVTNASLKFSLDKNGLEATDIDASCAGSRFTGTGGVPEWKKPEVVLDLTTSSAVLARGVPESLGRTPDAPRFPHPPLTPLPNEPLKPGESGIGYKIRLGADTVLYGSVRLTEASLLIHTGKLDVNGFHDVLLDGKARFYGGRVTGACILGADPALPYHITADAKSVNAAALARDLPVLPVLAGSFDAHAVVTSKGKQLAPFLASLKGDLSASGQNVRLSGLDAQSVLPKLDASLRLRSGAWDGARLSADGLWRASGAMQSYSANCELNGKIAFGAGGVSFRNLPGEIRASQKSGMTIGGSLKGTFSANPGQGKFEASRATLEVLGQRCTGDVKLDTAKKPPAYQGALQAEIKSINAFLAKLGYGADPVPAAWNTFKLAGQFSGTPDAFRLSGIDAKAGQTGLTGSLGYNIQKKHLDVDLAASQINLSALGQGKHSASWDFSGLKGFGASGSISSRDLVVWDLRFVNARMPFNLDKGKLKVREGSASFCGAPLNFNATADFNHGLVFDASLAVKGFNVSQAAKDRKITTRLTGVASAEVKIGAKLSGTMKLLPALNGQWLFNISNGSWQSAEKDGSFKGKPNQFQVVRASGNLRNGIVRSDNFTLASDRLDVGGGGWVNLMTRELNCNLNVDFNGLPEFPLHLYGSLNDPKTSIGAGRMALNALGGLASGFVGAIGGLFKGVWNIFSR